MIIADENIERHWIDLLRGKGHEVLSILEAYPGLSDRNIAALVKEYSGMLLTEDKDFGELVFAQGIRGLTIVFFTLRSAAV